MDKTKLFPTASTLLLGGDKYAARTQMIRDLLTFGMLTSMDQLDAYTLGWAQPEDLPRCIAPAITGFYPDRGTLAFERYTPTKNTMIGYGEKTDNDITTMVRSVNGGALESTQTAYTNLWNQMYPEYIGAPTVIHFQIIHCLEDTTDGTFQVLSLNPFDFQLTYKQLIDFVNGDYNLPIAAIPELNEPALEVSYEELKDTGFLRKEGANYNHLFFAVEVHFGGMYYTQTLNPGSWSTYSQAAIVPMFLMETEVKQCLNEAIIGRTCKSAIIGPNIGGRFASMTLNTHQISYEARLQSCAPQGYIPISDFDSTAMDKVFLWDITDENEGGVVFQRYSDNARYVYPIIPMRQLCNVIFLLPRAGSDTGLSSYHTGDSYATDVDEDNKFLAKWKTGNIDNTEFKNSLRPWQYSDFQQSEFLPGQAPDYVVPEPEPDVPGEAPDEGNWGVPVTMSQTMMLDNAFSNYEVLRASGLNEFVSELWQAPQNFWEALSVTKEVNANLGDYIISCRAYPVNLNTTNTHHDIYIGAGGKISLVSDVDEAATTNWIQLGRIRIPRQYRNFLDYNPYTSATISLPFAGTFEINPKFLYDSEIDLMLCVDITDGSGMWVVYNTAHGFPILTKQCRIAADIPISGLNASQMASNILNATLTSGQHALNAVNKLGVAASQTAGAVMAGTAMGVESIVTTVGQVGIQSLVDATNMAMGNKEIPYYTGGSGGAAAAESNFEPYITLRRPLCTNPENFAHTVGNLVNKTAQIGSLSGFTGCRNVDISGITQATDKEKAQIKKILESGFYA